MYQIWFTFNCILDPVFLPSSTRGSTYYAIYLGLSLEASLNRLRFGDRDDQHQ